MKRVRISLVEEGEESSGVWDWEERKVGRVPRKAVSQRERLGECSKSLEAREAIWIRRDWALGSGGRRERRVEDEGLEDECGACEAGPNFGGLGFGTEGELGFVRPSLAGDCTIWC